MIKIKVTADQANEIIQMIREQAKILGVDLSGMGDIELVQRVTRLVTENAVERV